MRQFSAGPIKKDVPSFRNRLTECVTIDGRRSDHYFSIQKRVHTSGVRAVLNA